ncbi:hypothetical protein LXL04_008816 [Taraxacum kok-saghyz]
MPLARVMGDMLLLPNGHVLLINGASAGVVGWELGRNPVLSPIVYQPDRVMVRVYYQMDAFLLVEVTPKTNMNSQTSFIPLNSTWRPSLLLIWIPTHQYYAPM